MPPVPAAQNKKTSPRKLSTPLIFAALAIACASLSACGAPGAPTPPKPLLPKPVRDLTARQQGAAVVLTFTLPKQSTDGDQLVEPPAIEVFRGERPAGGAEKLTTKLIYTVPSNLVDTYENAGQIEFRDPLNPAALKGQEMVYMVRTRASKKRASDDSNVVATRVFAVPVAPASLHASVTETAIELSWTAPQRSPSFTGVTTYRVYRAVLAPDAVMPPKFTDLAQVKLAAPLELLGPAPSTNFPDTHFAFDTTYIYVVRSVVDVEGQPVESSDSAPFVLTPKDIFPPAAPQGVVGLFVPATQDSPAHVELSWDISTEPDLAGYWVYRSEQPDTPGQRLNKELLLTPTFRDMTTVQGKRFTYRVAAVDRSGNESSLSTPLTVTVPQ
jgi:hypothetical protein